MYVCVCACVRVRVCTHVPPYKSGVVSLQEMSKVRRTAANPMTVRLAHPQ